MTLRSKIVGGTIFLLLAISTVTILAVRFIIVERLETELIKRGESIARSVAAGAFDPILTEDRVSLKQVIMKTAAQEEDLAYLFVLDDRDNVLGHTFTGGFPVSLRTVNSTGNGSAVVITRLSLEGEEVYDIALPIAGGDLGTVRAGFRAATVKAGVKTVMSLGAAVTLLATFLAGLVAFAMEQRIFTPISRLTEAAGTITGGRFDLRVPEDSDDEIGTLARAFNRMMNRIEEARSALLEANEDLEREIVERQDAEKRVREREHELKMIFDSSPVLMALVSRGGTIRKMNRAWHDLRSEGVEENVDVRIGAALGCLEAFNSGGDRCGGGEDCENCLIRKTISAALERGVQLRQVEAAVEHRRGYTAYFLVSATPIEITAEKRVLVCVEDITPLKTTELELKKAFAEVERQNEELRKIDVIKSSLIRDVTHELKTPVAKFVMQLEMLERAVEGAPLDQSVRTGLMSMRENLVRQQSVIRNILDMSRLEKGGRRYRQEDVRIHDLLERLIVEYKVLTGGRKLTIEQDLAPVTVESDGDMLWHVFSNLLGNAIKFTGDDGQGRISIAARQEGDRAVVTIRDNGIGLSDELAEKVFDPFIQNSASEEGIGVGLTLCRMIMEGLGGDVKLTSPGTGLGATATVTVPVAS